jgi:hypothetical protein
MILLAEWCAKADGLAPRGIQDNLQETFFLFFVRITSGNQFRQIANEFGVNQNWLYRACAWWSGFISDRVMPTLQSVDLFRRTDLPPLSPHWLMPRCLPSVALAALGFSGRSTRGSTDDT